MRVLQRRRTTKVPTTQRQMIYRPTVVPVEGGNNMPAIQADPYFSLKVDTTGVADAVQIVLFDASMGFQLNEQYVMPAGVVITGLTSNYQAMLNDAAHVSSYIDILKMTVSDDSVALQQYARPLEIYDSSKGSRPRLVKTLFPEMGVHEGQYQKGINTFTVDMLITNRTALVYTQEPGIVVTWGAYQKAELGRKQ